VASREHPNASREVNRNRRKGRGHGALCAILHLGVVGEPGGSGRGEGVRDAINNWQGRVRSGLGREGAGSVGIRTLSSLMLTKEPAALLYILCGTRDGGAQS